MISSFGATDIGSTSNRENQDTFLVTPTMFVVADGHGRAGSRVAAAATAVFEANPTNSMTQLFAEAEDASHKLFEDFEYEGAGGTTLSALRVRDDGSCEVAHVGDSEVRYFDDDGPGVSLTADHSPCSLEEFIRIRTFPTPARFEFAGTRQPIFTKKSGSWTLNPTDGHQHCTVRGDWSAYIVSPTEEHLAVTRAIGDFSMKEYGVIAEPTIAHAAPPVGTVRAIVMASDGLWDTMQYSDIGAIVRRPDLLGNAEAATKVLMETGISTARQLFGSHIDNITVVVVYVSV